MFLLNWIILIVFSATFYKPLNAENTSKVWVTDNGNGTYTILVVHDNATRRGRTYEIGNAGFG